MDLYNRVATQLPQDTDVTSAHDKDETLNNKEHEIYRSIITNLFYLLYILKPRHFFPSIPGVGSSTNTAHRIYEKPHRSVANVIVNRKTLSNPVF